MVVTQKRVDSSLMYRHATLLEVTKSLKHFKVFIYYNFFVYYYFLHSIRLLFYFYYRATLCVSAVFAVVRYPSVCHVRVLYPEV